MTTLKDLKIRYFKYFLLSLFISCVIGCLVYACWECGPSKPPMYVECDFKRDIIIALSGVFKIIFAFVSILSAAFSIACLCFIVDDEDNSSIVNKLKEINKKEKKKGKK